MRVGLGGTGAAQASTLHKAVSALCESYAGTEWVRRVRGTGLELELCESTAGAEKELL